MIDALIIVRSFLGYTKGQIITNTTNVNSVLDSEFRRHVVTTRVTDPGE